MVDPVVEIVSNLEEFNWHLFFWSEIRDGKGCFSTFEEFSKIIIKKADDL